MWHRVVDCLDVAVEITSRVPAIDAQLDTVFATYRDTTHPPAVAYELAVADWPQLARDGVVASRHDDLLDLVPALERDLYVQVMARATGVLLHACAVTGRDGRALIFAGRSGAGKSTLIRALLDRGFAYLSEECVALATATCRGLARALHADDDRIAPPRGFASAPYVIRRPDGEHRTRLFLPPEARVWRGEAHAAAIVAIDHAANATGALEPTSVGAAMALLWPLVFRPDAAALATLPEVLVALARYRLITARPEQALDRALALAEELDVEP